MKGHFHQFTLATLFVIAVFSSGNAEAQYPLSFEIPLKSGPVVLQRGSIDPEGSRYVIVQFDRTLSEEERAELEGQGINLLSFLYNKAWLCAAQPAAFTRLVITNYAIAAVTPWRPEYKITPRFRDSIEKGTITSNGKVRILVTFFEDMNMNAMENILNRYSQNYRIYRAPNMWTLEMELDLLASLMSEEAVQSIDEIPKPPVPALKDVRATIKADDVQDIDLSFVPPKYDGLSGEDVNIVIVEAFEPASGQSLVYTDHPGFWDHDTSGNPIRSRFLNPRPGKSGSGHATAVAGIAGGNGWFSTNYQWRGIAPEASLITVEAFQGHEGYDGYTGRIDVSNHSYCTDGTYNSEQKGADEDIRGKWGPKYRRSHIFAAGNQGVRHGEGGQEIGYYSICSSGKNVVTVGAVHAVDKSLAEFSSLGPTFDGRIKPDIVVPGAGLRLPILAVNIDYIRVIDPDNTILLPNSGCTLEEQAYKDIYGLVPIHCWEFNQPGDFEGWNGETYLIDALGVAAGSLNFKLGQGGYIGTPQNGFILHANSKQRIEIRYRIENPHVLPSVAARGWWSFENGDYVDGLANFDTILDGAWHTVSIAVGKVGVEVDSSFAEIPGSQGWKGIVSRLRLDPIRGTGIVTTGNVDAAYVGRGEEGGTSMAAPVVTGTVALMLQKYVEKHGVNLDAKPPLPSTIKAILIQTAKDLVHTKADPRDPKNPDTRAPVLYYKGPDFATGYGLVDAQAAVNLIADAASKSLIHESKLPVNAAEVFQVLSGAMPELKVTLAWDDVEGSTTLGDQRVRRLVNNLDVVAIDPTGKWHRSWRLDPPPVADCGGKGPGCGDFDIISPNDIKPAYKGPDARNNVEQVHIEAPVSGTWKILVSGAGIQAGPQTYSLVSNVPLTKLVGAVPPLAIKGDLNGDRTVDLRDYDMMLVHISNVRDYKLRDDSFNLNSDKDTEVNLADAFAIIPSAWSEFIVNNLVDFNVLRDTINSTGNVSGCPSGFTWKYSFSARLTGPKAPLQLSDLLIRVNTLSNGNVLLTELGNPGGAGTLLPVPKEQGYSDALLSYPFEAVNVPVDLCLKERKPFMFLVDVLGIRR